MSFTRPSSVIVLLLTATSVVLILLGIAQQTGHTASPIASWRKSRHKTATATQDLVNLHLAETLWQQSVTDRQKMLADGFSDDPDKVIQDFIWPYNVWDLFRPTFYCPYDLERVGKLGDGGKWVCGMSRYQKLSPGPSSEANPEKTIVVYSFGVEHDSSFEAALLQRTNAEIWGFDYSVEGWAEDIPLGAPRAHFSKAAIGGETARNENPPRLAVRDIMRQNGHSFVDMVKMDIEGAEFKALSAFMDAVEEEGAGALEMEGSGAMGLKPLPIGQLLVELHLNKQAPQTVRDFLVWFERLERMGMRPVFNEHNWIGDVGSGHPQFIEYTFVNVEHFERSLAALD